jgi:Mrp family chromosome partitioning ATPase/uncharacterized protein involved in exopolysaccharide biosynthesis
MDTTRALGTGEEFDFEEPSAPPAANPLMTIHLLLQGRYWIAILLGIVLAIIGALVGYKVAKVSYVCTGAIHIKPYVVIPLVDKNGMMPMYESYVNLQIARLRSGRVVELAVSLPLWVDPGGSGKNRSNSQEAIDAFKKKLNIFRDGEIIYVQFSDPDRETTRDAVGAMVDAYNKLSHELNANDPSSQVALLSQLQIRFQNEVDEFQKKIAEVAYPDTPESLKMQYEAQSENSNTLRRDWDNAKIELEAFTLQMQAAATRPKAAAATEPAPDIGKLTPEQIAARGDQQMKEYLSRRNQLQSQINSFLRSVGPKNLVVVNLKYQLDDVEAEIQKLVENWKEPVLRGAAVEMTGLDAQQQLQLLQTKEATCHLQYERSYEAQLKLGEVVGRIRKLESDMEGPRSKVEEAKKQVTDLGIAAQQQGYVEILSTGETPELKDRRIPIAAASAFGGIVLGIGSILIWGLLDRRLRSIDQARMQLQQGMRVLGMLPSLPKNLEDPSAASFAALCVHHIRMLLQVMPRLDGRPAIAVTSPSPGDGKTSLTLALALSFAASGKSTLLIDCDMAGAGLTRRVNAIIRRRIGQILIREQLITPAELREALSAAQRSGRRLGEVLVDEGYVDAEQLAKALKVQGESPVGLMDVMRGELLEDCVADTGTPRLWILPMGSAQAEHAASISPEGFRGVLEQARKRFEVILVDTGPVPGSIESSVAVSQTDGVVMCVSRGEQGPLVRRASEHMRDVGARALGIVFNRATPEDFSSSYGAMSSPSIPERVREKSGTDSSQFGPVAAAVAGRPAQQDPDQKG